MTTSKKTNVKKQLASATKRVKKPAAKKVSVKTAKVPAARKHKLAEQALPKVSVKTTKIPAGREHKLAEQALQFVDEAASYLRSGIRTGAATTAESRIAAKKKAHGLLGKASATLSNALDESTSVIQNLIGKI